MQHVALAALEDGLVKIRRSPRRAGRVELIVRRPVEDEREVLAEARLDPAQGLVGDRWGTRPSGASEDGAAQAET